MMLRILVSFFMWVAISREGIELGTFYDYKTCINYVKDFDGDCIGRETF